MPAAADAPATRDLAELYSMPPQRAAFAALRAVEAEIGASLRTGIEHQVAHARLAWWQEECRRFAAGMPQHPLTRQLATTLGAAVRHADLGGFLDTVTWDLAQATFETRRELSAYCARWSAAMLTPLLRLASAAPEADAAALGVPLRELELLLALAPEARAGRVRLPLDELGAAGCGTETPGRPPWPAPLCALLAARHRQLRAALQGAVAALPLPARAQLRGLVVWIALTCRHSQRAERALPHAARGNVLPALLDGWRAWRIARRAAADTLLLA